MDSNELDYFDKLINSEDDIKSAWGVYKLFEHEKNRAQKEKDIYKDILNKRLETQKKIEDENLKLQNVKLEIAKKDKELSEKFEDLKFDVNRKEKEIETLEKSIKILEKKLKEFKLQESEHLNAKEEELKNRKLEFPMHQKKVMVQNVLGQRTNAAPVKKLYAYKDVKEIYELYLDAKKVIEKLAGHDVEDIIKKHEQNIQKDAQIEDLKQKILDLELENAKLKVEIKDYNFEKNIK